VGDKIELLSVSSLDDPPILLRPIDRTCVEYLELRDSMTTHGLVNSIAVRPYGDRYQVVDGVNRTTVARDLGWETIPCLIKQVSDSDLLLLQLAGNAVRVTTKPVEFARQIRRILKEKPDMKIGEMAVRLNKSAAWIGQQLRLLDLSDEDQQMIDRGEINLANAYMYAQVPKLARASLREQAKTLSVREFKAVASGVTKQFTEQVRKGKLDGCFRAEFKPQPYLRSLPEVRRELARRVEGPRIVTQENCVTPLDGFYAALLWAQNLDREGLREQEERYLSKLRNTNE
jgi:ParB/RepB/Spo0J family partition protein